MEVLFYFLVQFDYVEVVDDFYVVEGYDLVFFNCMFQFYIVSKVDGQSFEIEVVGCWDGVGLDCVIVFVVEYFVWLYIFFGGGDSIVVEFF